MQNPPVKSAPVVWLWLAYTAFVVYGSLVPLDFHPMPLARALHLFRDIPFLQLGVGSRADWVANGVLYFPLGYLTATVFVFSLGRLWMAPALFLAAVLCCALAVGVEFTQLFFPPRTVSLNDLMAESIGSVLGVLFAPFLLPWLKRFQLRLARGGLELSAHLLEILALSYLLMCFFPYDFLLNAEEFVHKVESLSWGWWLAGVSSRPVIILMQLSMEVLVASLFGVLLAKKNPNVSLKRAAFLGLLLGLMIETLQFTIATGITQGASVLTRSLGCVIGVLLWRARDRLTLTQLSALVRAYWMLLALLYGFALATVNAWFLHPWHDMDKAMAAWPEVRLMPFYYHYYTTEAQAVHSLGVVALMYAPLAILAWANNWSMRVTMLLAVAFSFLIELSKLFLDGAHPDPSNIFIAAAACAMVRQILKLIQSRGVAQATVPSLESDDISHSAHFFDGSGVEYDQLTPTKHLKVGATAGLILSLSVAGLSVVFFPVFQVFLCVLLLGSGIAIYVRPVLALLIIPAAMPVLDLAPWSGRFFFDEFDFLMLVCISIGLYRSDRNVVDSKSKRNPFVLLLGLSFLISVARALLPWQWPDANSFISYTNNYNALRIVKGALLAYGFMSLFYRFAAPARTRMFSIGMQTGLALTVLFIFWERAAVVNLFDFISDYRITGPISGMHKGGAYIECFLSVASAFTVVSILRAETWRSRILPTILLLATTYAVMVTYSRNGYAAFVLILFVIGIMSTWTNPKKIVPYLLLLVMVGGSTVVIVAGKYGGERLAQSANDLSTRKAHWMDALNMRDDTWATHLFGVGLGRFPATHYWNSVEARHAGSYKLESESGNGFLSLGAGASLYIEQIVRLEPGKDYLLSARVRTNLPAGAVNLALCQKWMLTSAKCESVTLNTTVASEWQRVEAQIKASDLTQSERYVSLPLKLAITTPSANLLVDIDDLQMRALPSANVLLNGDFSNGLDHWFFTTDVDPPWHIHSLPIAILFDQGWFGVLAWSALFCMALFCGFRQAWRGSTLSLATSAALFGFLVSGSLNTLIDAPRFLFLLLVLIALSYYEDSDNTEPAVQEK